MTNKYQQHLDLHPPLMGTTHWDGCWQSHILCAIIEAAKWQANHDQMAQRNAVLRERPDLPVDRLPAIERYEAEIRQLRRDMWDAGMQCGQFVIDAGKEIEKYKVAIEAQKKRIEALKAHIEDQQATITRLATYVDIP